MKVASMLGKERITLSFEVFPPRNREGIESVEQAMREIAALQPDFISVTFGATGGRSEFTLPAVTHVQNMYHVPAIAHFTCVSSTRSEVHRMMSDLRDNGISNILALRGDIPEGNDYPMDYHYAYELIEEIRSFGGFCIGAACYPDGHPESRNMQEDIQHLKEKVDAGVDYLITQMFFDNNILYNYLYRIREKGINVPLVAGIMPVTNVKQIKRIRQLSGTYLPMRFKAMLDRFGDNPAAMTEAGIAYATEQIIDLIANNVNNIHVYSMNKPGVAARIKANLAEILEMGKVDDASDLTC